MYLIQEFMRPCKFEEPNGNITILTAIINPKFPAKRNCAVPACEYCILERSKKRSANTKKVKPLEEKEGDLLRDKIEVGYFVSTDKFVCKTPSRLPNGYGRESSDHHFQGGVIYNDTTSSLVWVENKVSLGSNETVMCKSRFEQWLWDQAESEVSHYHGDNFIFNTTEYHHDCNKKGQTQSFSGVGAQHQNTRYECAIQTIRYMTRPFMVHDSLHCYERGYDDILLWSFAVKHLVCIYNLFPGK